MKAWLVTVAGLCIAFAATGCGGGEGGKVSAASLTPRLLPPSSVPGFGLQRTLNWDDPVNLVGEGLSLPQVTHPSAGVKQFKDEHLRGSAGEILVRGAGLEEQPVQIGVAKFRSEGNANAMREWLHRQDLTQPCFSQCAFAPAPVVVPGIPNLSMVVQSSHATAPPGTPPPPGAPKGFRVTGPANYLAEFTIGSYLYWAILHTSGPAQAQFEAGLRLYYAHARQFSA